VSLADSYLKRYEGKTGTEFVGRNTMLHNRCSKVKVTKDEIPAAYRTEWRAERDALRIERQAIEAFKTLASIFFASSRMRTMSQSARNEDASLAWGSRLDRL
jgi:hypothetical protein